MSVQAPLSIFPGIPSGSLTLTDAEAATLAESIKFAACVPKRLLVCTIMARDFEVTLTPKSSTN